MSIFDVAKLRPRLCANGYRPIPYPTGAKNSFEDGWLTLARCDPPAAVSRRYDPGRSNTGLLCDGLVAIDVDLLDPQKVERTAEYCFEQLGTPLVRQRCNSPNYFFHSGTGVVEIYLQHMNSHCARLNLPPISFRETNVGDYARSSDRPYKAQSRSLWREEWCDLPAPERATMMREWEMQMAEAEPAHRTYEEFKGDREQDSEYSSRQERQRRETAVIAAARRAEEEAQEARTRAATERATRLTRQLRMAATLPDAERDRRFAVGGLHR